MLRLEDNVRGVAGTKKVGGGGNAKKYITVRYCVQGIYGI